MKFMNTMVAETLCELAGQILKLPNAKTEECGSFMQVWVMVDISQPLCRGRMVTLDDNRELCVSFKYERLPNLCYWCGCLTHNDRDYDRWIESEGSLTDVDKEYGAWLKALPWSKARNSVVEVPGFYSKMKAKRTSQRQSDETMNSTAARATPLSPPFDLLQAQYGNILSDSVKANSFHNNSLSVSMSTNPVLVENNTTDPTQLHTNPGPAPTSNLTFDQQLEAIDQDLMKFDHPMHVSPLTPTPHYHMPSSPHHEQDVAISNLTTIPSDPPPTNSTHSTNSYIPTTINSPPHPSHTSSWKRILKATIAHTHNLSTLSGSKRALNEDQPELPNKRHAVSQVVDENTQLLAEAGYQPC